MTNDITIPRPIRFRGKSVEDGRWVYGDLSQYSDDYPTISGSYVENADYEELDEKDIADNVKVLASTVGQFTGLYDRKGKEIWEDSIVMINHPLDNTGDFTNKPGRVFWYEDEGGWYHGHESVKGGSGRPPKRMWKYTKVIGTVHDSPELLKGEE